MHVCMLCMLSMLCMYVRMYVCMYVWLCMYVCMYVCMCFTYIYMYTYVRYIYICICVCVDTRISHLHTYIPTYILSYAHSCLLCTCMYMPTCTYTHVSFMPVPNRWKRTSLAVQVLHTTRSVGHVRGMWSQPFHTPLAELLTYLWSRRAKCQESSGRGRQHADARFWALEGLMLPFVGFETEILVLWFRPRGCGIQCVCSESSFRI